MPELLKLYHSLPAPMQTVAASMWGYYLRWWRYGAETEGWVEEALDREYWSADQWKSWREENLSRLLHRAATRVPYYRDQWERRRREGDRLSWELLENWPILSKDTVRSWGSQFVADDCNIRSMYQEHTSGTSGKSLA